MKNNQLTIVATVATIVSVKAIGVKNLKNNLSRYLKMVRNGERIFVTDRDDVIAEIHRPTTSSPGQVSQWEAFLNEEESRGVLRRADEEGFDLKFLGKEPSWPPELQEESQAIFEKIRSDRL